MKWQSVALALGAILFLFGTGLDLTVVGLPEGLTLDVVGIALMFLGGGMAELKDLRALRK